MLTGLKSVEIIVCYHPSQPISCISCQTWSSAHGEVIGQSEMGVKCVVFSQNAYFQNQPINNKLIAINGLLLLSFTGFGIYNNPW